MRHDSYREHAPSIIFMDEVDSIGSTRMEGGSGGGDSEVQRTMLELLNQLDGFEATNRIKARASAHPASVPLSLVISGACWGRQSLAERESSGSGRVSHC